MIRKNTKKANAKQKYFRIFLSGKPNISLRRPRHNFEILIFYSNY